MIEHSIFLKRYPMNKVEKRTARALALLFSFRMLGLFLILPVFSIYATKLSGATASLIGFALGVYGLTQALLQIPFGMLSDKIGRKPVIAAGLVLFAIGSVIAASADSIYGVIIGRAIQGAGAIGSTIIALAADLTREEQRTKAMAIIGLSIGFSFTIAMAISPVLNNWIGVNGIFWLTAGLALLGLFVTFVLVPKTKAHKFHRDAEVEPTQLKMILKNPELLRLDFGILVLHAMLTALFLIIPLTLQQIAGVPESRQWIIYLPVLILSFICMLPFIIIAEKKRKIKQIFIGAIATLIIAQLILFIGKQNELLTALGLLVFFTAFTLLEATLPSLISKIAPSASKGTATGVYSSCQFLGIFIGGTVGGWFYAGHNFSGVFLFSIILGLIWLAIASTMKKPRHLGTHMLNFGALTRVQADNIQKQLLAVDGIIEATVMCDDGIAYLKVDNAIIDKANLSADKFKR